MIIHIYLSGILLGFADSEEEAAKPGAELSNVDRYLEQLLNSSGMPS
jgi:hypothetical protein